MSLLHYFEALEASPIGVFVKDRAATVRDHRGRAPHGPWRCSALRC
jgi:hypothetical protein